MVEIPLIQMELLSIKDIKFVIDNSVRRGRIKCSIEDTKMDILFSWTNPNISLKGLLVKLIGKDMLRDKTFELDIVAGKNGVTVKGYVGKVANISKQFNYNYLEIVSELLRQISIA